MSTLTPRELDASAQCSPEQTRTTSPLALPEMLSAGQLVATCSPVSDAHKGYWRQEAKGSLSRQKLFKGLPLDLAENDSDSDCKENSDTYFSSGEGMSVAATINSAREDNTHRRDSWDGFQSISNVPLGSEHLSVRGRSHSAPPDPLEVIKTQLKNKTVTICESPDEISVQLEQPQQIHSVPVHSYSHLAGFGTQPFSPLTLKPVEQSFQVWLGTGEGRCVILHSIFSASSL